MIVYIVKQKCPQVDTDQYIEAFSSLKKALMRYDESVNYYDTIEDYSAWVELHKIQLKDLSTKRMYIALLSGRGYIKHSEIIKSWRQDGI